MNLPLIGEDRIISAAERRHMIPYSDMHIWRLEKAGRFPKRIRIGKNRVGWSFQELQEWIGEEKKRSGRFPMWAAVLQRFGLDSRKDAEFALESFKEESADLIIPDLTKEQKIALTKKWSNEALIRHFTNTVQKPSYYWGEDYEIIRDELERRLDG